MAKLGKVLGSVYETRGDAKQILDVELETLSGVNETSEQYLPSGYNARPMDGDYSVIQDTEQTGRSNSSGVVDTVLNVALEKGETQIYSRDSEGALVAEVTLRTDGAVTIKNQEGEFSITSEGVITAKNSKGSAVLDKNGTLNINGVTIDKDGKVNIPSSLVLNGIEHASHGHTQSPDSDGNTQQKTDGPS